MLSVCAVILFLFSHDVAAQGAGEPCTTKQGGAGTCINILSCPSAMKDIQKRINPQICGFSGPDPIVCCVSNQPTLTTSTHRPTQPPKGTPSDYYQYVEPQTVCEPLSSDLTAPKNEKKAWNKCLEYQEKYVYPCVKSSTLTLASELVRTSQCGHNADELIIGGVETQPREFPHMVLLGFGEPLESTQWQCGGSVISDWFILTAGHCTSSREFGDVTFIRLATNKRTDQIDSNRVYRVASIIRHPDYKSPTKYNDIALLKTDRQIKLDQFTVPACLYTGGEGASDEKAIATGWGSTQYKGPLSNTMQKVTLEKFSSQECAQKFPSGRHMEQGFNSNTQVCYGSKVKSKDTCQGDSGGPLQIKNKRIQCMYTLIGITSFGKACGFVGDPGIYTKVEPFVPWIESVVWRD